MEISAKLKADKAAKITERYRAQLRPGEEVAFIGVCNNFKPSASYLMVTNIRLLAVPGVGSGVSWQVPLVDVTVLNGDAAKKQVVVATGRGDAQAFKLVPPEDHPVLIRHIEAGRQIDPADLDRLNDAARAAGFQGVASSTDPGPDADNSSFGATPTRSKQAEKVAKLVSDDRADIEAAVGRMATRVNSKRAIKSLPTHLHLDETVQIIAAGQHGPGGYGIAVLTDRRFFFVTEGWNSGTLTDFPLGLVAAVSTSRGMASGNLSIHVAGSHAVITGVRNADLHPLADAIRQRMVTPQQTPTPQVPDPPVAEPVDDRYAGLRKLADLHSQGILTDDEFTAAKAKALGL